MAKRIKRDPKKAVVYIRVSDEKQAISGLGLADQLERCKLYCEMKDFEIVEIYQDEVISAGKPLHKRKGGIELLETLKRSPVGAVVTLKLDRIFRSTLDALSVVDDWNRFGVAFHMVDFGGSAIDTSTATGKMFLTLMAGFAEFERGLVSERTKAALAIKKANGERVGRIPYGKELGADGKTLVNCPKEQECILRIGYFRRKGLTLMQITDTLNSIGYRNRNGKKWNKSSIHRILSR